MIFERAHCKPFTATERRVARELSLAKSSFASLTACDGSYLQAAGGPGLFLLEYRATTGAHHRGSQRAPVVPFPDGTVLSFSGGSISLAQNEWFLLKQVVEVFTCFLSHTPFPSWLVWHKLSPSDESAAQQ